MSFIRTLITSSIILLLLIVISLLLALFVPVAGNSLHENEMKEKEKHYSGDSK